MKVTEAIQKAQNTFLSFEILPPLKGKSIESLDNIIQPLKELNPPFINVTYHRAEYEYKERASGIIEKVAVRKRPGTVGICAAIQYRHNVDAVAHIICGGFSRNDTEDALIDLNYLGINNVLALRGDPPKNEKYFKPEENGNHYALDLVKQIKAMNEGKYLEDDLKNATKTDFCIGIAGYPEKHFEAPNLNFDLANTKAKIDAGADYIITQMFFDNKVYFNYVKQCRNIGINVPIIPGLKPITLRSQLQHLPSTFHIDIPEELYNEVRKAPTDADACNIGIEWAVQQCKELLAFGVPCLHFFTMSNPKPILKIAEKLGY